MGKYAAEDLSGPSPLFSDKTYNVLRWFVELLLPGLGALYFGLSQLWALPNPAEVVGTISLLTIFFGSLIGISRSKYNSSPAKFDGALVFDETDPMKDTFTLEVGNLFDTVQTKDAVTLKVVRPSG